MATVTKWTPFGVALDITATAATITRKSATQFTVKINTSWKTYYSGARTNYGMTASSGGGSVNLNTFGTKSSSGSGSFTGTYSISGNGSASKTITVTFKNYEEDWQGNVTESATKTVSFNVTVPAWTSYTIKYNANGGTGAPSNQTKWKDQTLKLSTTKPTRTGYTFQGWATSASGSVAYASGANYTTNPSTSSVTLYAVWKAITYTIKYNANGGTGAPSNQTKTYGKTLTLSSANPTRSSYINENGDTVSYTFKGWATSASSSTVAYKAGASYTANAAATLYAVWTTTTTINTYDIIYETGDGTKMSSQVKTRETDIVLSSIIPERNGFTFVSWNTVSDGSGTSYNSGDIYSVDEDLILYAIWIPWEHTVSFDVNGGSGNIPVGFTKTGGVDQIISGIMPIKSGYAFSYWNTEPDGSGLDYYPNEAYNGEQNGGSVVLYAIWETNDILIYSTGEYKSREFIEGDNYLSLNFVNDGTVRFVEFVESDISYLTSTALHVTELLERTLVQLTDESDVDLTDESDNYLMALI